MTRIGLACGRRNAVAPEIERTKHSAVCENSSLGHRDLLKSWDYSELSSIRGKSDYWRKFPCPGCGADAWESLTERKTRRNRFGEEWVMEQGGECDHVPYERYVLVTCQAVGVYENGNSVATVEPDPGDPVYWLRERRTRRKRHGSTDRLWHSLSSYHCDGRAKPSVEDCRG